MSSTSRLIVSDNETLLNRTSDVVLINFSHKASCGASRLVGLFTSRLTVALHPNQWFGRKTAPGAKTNKNSAPDGRITLGKIYDLSICVKNSELHHGVNDCYRLKWESENRKSA